MICDIKTKPKLANRLNPVIQSLKKRTLQLKTYLTWNPPNPWRSSNKSKKHQTADGNCLHIIDSLTIKLFSMLHSSSEAARLPTLWIMIKTKLHFNTQDPFLTTHGSKHSHQPIQKHLYIQRSFQDVF